LCPDFTPVLLVVTSRDEELADAPATRRILDEISREPHVTRATLAPLARPDIIDLIHSLARIHGEPDGLAQIEEHVWTVSEGNPFVAVETTRALLDGGPPPESTKLPLPDRVRAMIASRLDRLSDPAHQLAAVAAVIGREFEFRLLHRASGLDEASAAEGVEELVRRHVLRGVGEQFDFTHDRIRAVAYDRLLWPQRKVRHRRVAEVVEALYAGNLEAYQLALGAHFREGEVWDKAVDFFRRAGAAATARSASREAVACFRQALDALDHLPRTPDTIRLSIDIRRDLQSGCILLGELPRMLGTLQEAEPLAKALGDERRLALIWAHMALAFWWTGQFEAAADYSQRALEMATALGDHFVEVLASARLSLAYVDWGDYRLAIEAGKRCIKAASGDLARELFEMASLPAVCVRGYMTTSFALLGDFAEAAAAADEALEIATAANHPYSVALALAAQGRWRAFQGNFIQALPWLEQSLEGCRREGFYLFGRVAAHTGSAYARVGRIGDGIALLEAAVERETAIGFMASRSQMIITRADAYLAAERFDEALLTARQGLELSRANKHRALEAEMLHTLGEIEARQDPPDAASAAESYRQALALASEIGMRPLAARCHLGLGRLCRAASKRAAAEAHVTTARTMLAEMQMRFWLDQTETEIEQLAR
jgi:tetratricopeptide (TPR) repeat protein